MVGVVRALAQVQSDIETPCCKRDRQRPENHGRDHPEQCLVVTCLRAGEQTRMVEHGGGRSPCGAATVKPKFSAYADPASQWAAAWKGPAFFAYSTNYLIDTDHSIIVDACWTNKTAEVGAIRKMIDRTEERFDVKPDWIAADTTYGSQENLAWLALKRQILPFIPVFHCPAGHCAAMSREGTRVSARMARSPDQTSHGTMRTISISVRAAKRCGTHGPPIPTRPGMYRVGKPTRLRRQTPPHYRSSPRAVVRTDQQIGDIEGLIP